MSNSHDKNNVIIKNTLYMYGRMLFTLFISLFTARIVYNTLGVDNYGTYNLVGGIIIFFTFLNNGLSTATKRFITAEIGAGDEARVRHVFNTCILSHLFIAGIVLVLGETVGLWAVNNILNIPQDAIYAANWAYQFSVISAVLGIIQSPFGAIIVAYEKMNIFAYFAITDVLFNLGVIYLVQVIPGNKLIIYSSLVFGVGIINMIMYRTYTFYKIKTCRLQYVKDIPLLKEIFKFTGLSVLGQIAVVGANQGVSVLINVFNSVVVNAAMGVGASITRIISGFVGNFQAAFNPQIIKSYNAGDYTYLQSLLSRASKLSSYLIIVFFVPLSFEVGNVLKLWLGEYPRYAPEFCILSLVCIYIEAISAPFWMLIYSQTNIKKYQITISLVYSLTFFMSWFVLYLGFVPYSVMVVRGVVTFLLLIVRVYYTKYFFSKFNLKEWVNTVLLRGFIIIGVSSIITWFIRQNLDLQPLVQIITVTAVSLSCTVPMILFGGLSSNERQFIFNKIYKIIKLNR